MATGTKKLYPIDPKLFYVCPVDCGWKRQGSTIIKIDLLSGAAHDAIKQLKPRGILSPGGSISSWAHKKSDKLVTGGQGDAHNINPSEVKPPYTIQQVNNGEATYRFGKDFCNEYLLMAQEYGGLIYVMNMLNMTDDERKWVLDMCPVDIWVYGSEMNVITQYDTSAKYLTSAETLRKNLPGVSVLDVAPEGHDWNAALKANNFDGIRYYGHLKNFNIDFTDDWAANSKKVFDAFYITMSKELDVIRANWGKKILNEQHSWDYKIPILNGTMLACLSVVWDYDSMIRYNVKNPGAIMGASTSLKQLVDDGRFSNVGKTCKLIGNMFEGTPNFVELSGLPFGCNGFGVWDSETKKYKAIIASKESTFVTLPSVTIDGRIKKCISWNQVYATSLQDKIVNETTGTGAAPIKSYSVTQINL